MNNEELRQKIESILPEGWKFKDFLNSTDIKYAGGFRVTCPLDDRMGKTYREKINAICEGVNAICDGGGWGRASDIYTNYFYLKKEKPMNTEQEEVLDAAMDVASDNEVGDPEDPPLLLPQFWSQEEKDGVENMLVNKDESLRKLAQRIVETWSGWPGYGICTKGHMTINKAGRDQYGTFTFEACGGFNYSLSRNAPYYFNQIATMMMFAKNWGVKVWPIKMKFDVADDLWTAEFGIDFNLDDNKAFLRKGAKEIGYIELEEELEEVVE